MARALRTADLARALARLTGVTPRRNSDGEIFRVVCDTADGHRHSVIVQVDTHSKEARPYVLPQIARALALSGPEELLRVLEEWGPEDLQAHLSKQPKAVLMPPRMRTR